jgi:hypothetical protein
MLDMSNRFSQIEEGRKFQFANTSDSLTLTKVGKNLAVTNDGTFRSFIHGNRRVTLIEEVEVTLDELIETDFHTFNFTPKQLEEVVGRIVQRAVDTYGAHRIDSDRLRKGVLRAHATNPIRLIALLHACAVDFPADVLHGIYRFYDPTTDTITRGWKAQHAEEHEPDIFDLLFGRL